MKIGILTQPLQFNYGGLVQAFALQTILEQMGHDVEVLNRVAIENSTPTTLKERTFYLIKWIIKKFISCPDDKSIISFLVSRKIDKFITKYIHKSPDLSSTEQLRSYSLDKQFDSFIVGSDQVWRKAYSPCIYNYFLDFTEGWNVKRIAYAASFGNENWDYSINDTCKCSDLISAFDAISVREKSGVAMVNEYLKASAKHVLDPTMLLNKSDYINLVVDENENHPDGEVFCYILDMNKNKKTLIQKACDKLGKKSYYCNSKRYFFAPDIELGTKPSVKYWLMCFENAKYTIVDSFHGVVFSIIFNKPFVAIGNDARGLSRFKSLLSLFSLEDRLIDNYNDISMIIEKPINWEKVNHIHCLLRKESLAFLEESLS